MSRPVQWLFLVIATMLALIFFWQTQQQLAEYRQQRATGQGP